MADTDFAKLYANEELRLHIADKAKAYSKSDNLRADLQQEAWLRLATCDPGQPIGWYKAEAIRAIEAAYKLYMRARKASEDYYDRCERVTLNDAWLKHTGQPKPYRGVCPWIGGRDKYENITRESESD